jgi:hypothetical protein
MILSVSATSELGVISGKSYHATQIPKLSEVNKGEVMTLYVYIGLEHVFERSEGWRRCVDGEEGARGTRPAGEQAYRRTRRINRRKSRDQGWPPTQKIVTRIVYA